MSNSKTREQAVVSKFLAIKWADEEGAINAMWSKLAAGVSPDQALKEVECEFVQVVELIDEDLGISKSDLQTALAVLQKLEEQQTAIARYLGESQFENNPVLEKAAGELWNTAHGLLDSQVAVQTYLDGYYPEKE